MKHLNSFTLMFRLYEKSSLVTDDNIINNNNIWTVVQTHASCLQTYPSLPCLRLSIVIALFTSSSHIWLWYSILDSLILQLQSDRVLVKSLNPSEPLRHLYIYESTMSLLTRLAMSAQGASALLNSALMSKLSECSVYDARPNISHRRWENIDRVQCNHWSHLYGANVIVHFAVIFCILWFNNDDTLIAIYYNIYMYNMNI